MTESAEDYVLNFCYLPPSAREAIQYQFIIAKRVSIAIRTSTLFGVPSFRWLLDFLQLGFLEFHSAIMILDLCANGAWLPQLSDASSAAS